MRQIDLMYRTMYAELAQRAADDSFDFDPAGTFVKQTSRGRDYWYFENLHSGQARKYVGPVDDKEITGRVEQFRVDKERFKGRRKIVQSLVREGGLVRPDATTGDVVEVLEKAGIFRLRGVLVGTVAFQTYSGYLGVSMPSAAMQTSDADLAQFHSISTAVEDSIPPILDTLKGIDETFRPIPHFGDNRSASQFINAQNYKVEFLTPNTGSDDHTDKPATMPALGGAAAQPLRFLDFLIYQPVRAVMLHRAGITVLVPAPERFAVHKLIVASRRLNDEHGNFKREKDVLQSRLLARAMRMVRQHDDLAVAFEEAWNRGPAWKEAIKAGLSILEEDYRTDFEETLRDGGEMAGIDLDFDDVFERSSTPKP